MFTCFECTFTKEELEKLYIEDKKNLLEMCEIVGCKSPITMSKILKKNGINTNRNQRTAEKTRNGMSEEEFKLFLEKSYTEGMSMRDISEKIGITPSGVRKYFVKYGIQRRNNAGYASVDPSFSPNWKGGRNLKKDGYVEIKVPNHPNANKRGYIYEHQYVVEKYIGRYLLKGEVVHHIDKNKSNNDISNLLLLTNSEHIKLHSILKKAEKRMQKGGD